MRVQINLEEKQEITWALKVLLEKQLVDDENREQLINLFNKLLTVKKGDRIDVR
jgi:hypothetical protein